MRIRLRTAVALLAMLLLLVVAVGCSTTVDTSGGGKNETLPFETLKKGNHGFTFGDKNVEYRVFRSRGQWKEFWDKAANRSMFADGGPKPFIDPDPYSDEMAPTLPDVDFGRETVIGVFFKGFSPKDTVSIATVKKIDNQLIVTIEHHRSNDGGIENTAPYQIVKVDETERLPVKFEVVEK